VASVFAYTVLSAGIFSSQKGQEAVYAGLTEARATMEIKGSMFAYGNDTGNGTGNLTVMAGSFTLTNAMKGQAIDLSPNDPVGNNTHVTIISYTDRLQHVSDLPWTIQFIGKDNGDNLLEEDEQAVVTVNLATVADGGLLTTSPGIYDSFTIEVKPVSGASLILNRTLPGRIHSVMDLH
jgi:flagellin FlaB